MAKRNRPAPVPEKLAAARRALVRLEERPNANRQLITAVEKIIKRYEREATNERTRR